MREYRLPWDGKYLVSNCPEDSLEDRCRQRITRAFEKAGEDGVPLEKLGDWAIDDLAERLYDKIINHFSLAEHKTP